MNGIIAFCIFGVVTLYSILFATISMTLFSSVDNPDSIWNSKMTYVILLTLAQLPHVNRKNMHEMKLGSYLLFTGIISLLLILQVKLYKKCSHHLKFHKKDPVV